MKTKQELMMRKIFSVVALLMVALHVSATDYFLSTTGSDANDGKSRETAFATLGKAQSMVKAGDKVYILPGTYTITEAQISKEDNPYMIVFNLNHQGQEGKPISFIGVTENGNRPVFDMSAVNPTGYRVTAFYVTGCYMVFRNFEVIGMMVNITDHTQSENFRIRNGSYNTFDNIACHDGMGIGFYLTNKSHHNLFLNCDGYNNYDSVSESGKGGQNDAFGCHVEAGQEGNIFIGCRAWNNADDGYDFINCYSPATICYSIAYHNGYDADGNKRQDGNGFKAGGFGMGSAVTLPESGAPRHEVYHCLASSNKSNGFYTNHHLGGVYFHHNTAYKNATGNTASNFSMVNRKDVSYPDGAVDVSGYNHTLEYNLSVHADARHISALDATDASNTVTGNSFYWDAESSTWKNNDVDVTQVMESTSVSRVTLARNEDGTLSANTRTYMQQKEYSGCGYDNSGYEAAIAEAKKLSGAEINTVPVTETVPMFITAGQSNTAGRCMNENLPDYIKALGTEYQYCNWSYTNGSTRKSDKEGVLRKFWPEMESANNPGRFAYDAIVYYWLEQALQKDFYVVKHAAGGTSIDPACTSTNDYHWSADATWLAEHASCNADGGTSMLKAFCDNIGKSIDALAADGKSADIKAMIWHQGESDRTGTGPDNYYANLKAVVKYVRDYLVSKTGDEKYAAFDFICGTVPPQSKQYNKKVYDALFTLASEDSHFHVIKTEPGTFIGDDLHFDTNCAERLGINMYNKMVDLGLVNGEKQAVPEPTVPEQTTITLDFSTWTKENIAEAGTYVSLIAEETSSQKTIDGTTAMYKVMGSEASGDFSEFSETFALATPANIQLRGAGHGLFANKKQSILSLLSLEAGDRVTITTKAGDGKNALKFVSTNAYKDGDATKTAVTAETEWASGDSYVITSNTQLDLLFGINTATTSYIYKVVIEKGAVEIPVNPDPVDPTDEPTQKVTIHTIGDSTMSSYDQSIPAQKGMDGWGDYLIECLKGEWATVYNWADRGETAKSYHNGIWLKTSTDRPEFGEPVMNKVNAGDYVIIQFGHNDSKAYDTTTYEEWLGTLVDAVKAKGATPIMAGSICRARFGSDGKITRLGRIDTGEENNVPESDHTYDYPYHAQQVATAKGIEFIDVTSGVKEMFETYGEAKTKALFPTGEKTHTNKLGAQLIAKVAAKLLLETALKNYVNTETLTLPDAADIDVIIDDFKNEAVVTRKTLWTFNDYKDGDVIAAAVATETETEKNVVELNGLYARGYTNRAINAVTSPVQKVAFSDGTEVEVSIAALPSQNYDPSVTTIAQNTAGRVAASALAPTFALNVGMPGTFYCILAPTKNNSERQERIIFSGKDVVAVPVATAWNNENHLCELKYHCETTGVIYIAAGITSNFYAMMFVPDMESGTEEDWNYQMVMTRENGYWSYCNLSGTDQQVPEGLTAYAVSSMENGAAVLTDIGEVIPAGMPVIVKGEPNTEYALPSANASARRRAAYSGENLLVGNEELRYLPATENGKTNYFFDGSQFVKATGGETIHTKQAYLSADVDAVTLELVIGSSTAITNVNANVNLNLNANCYDLQGRVVSHPTRGIYVQNGRKFVMK